MKKVTENSDSKPPQRKRSIVTFSASTKASALDGVVEDDEEMGLPPLEPPAEAPAEPPVDSESGSESLESESLTFEPKGKADLDSSTKSGEMADSFQSTGSFLTDLPSDSHFETSLSLQPKRRGSMRKDLKTGKSQRALVRSFSRTPQNSMERRRKRFMRGVKTLIKNPFRWHRNYDDCVDDSGYGSDTNVSNEIETTFRGRFLVQSRSSSGPEADGDKQYRLISAKNEKHLKQRTWGRIAGIKPNFSLYENVNDDRQSCQIAGIKPNRIIINYLNWGFRHNFTLVLCSGALWFFISCSFFAIIIYGLGYQRPYCIHVNGHDFGVNRTSAGNYMDAFALSWTTFSTVGYGLVYPGTGSTVVSNIQQCIPVTIVTSIESFVGILFASFMGAIIFAKVTRVTSVAQVSFSEPLVVRFGTGLVNSQSDEEASSEQTPLRRRRPGSYEISRLPCPTIEFRIMNKLHGREGGEIIDASLNIVAAMDNVDELALRRSGVTGVRRKRKGKGKNMKSHEYTANSEEESDDPDMTRKMPSSERIKHLRNSLHSTKISRRSFRRRKTEVSSSSRAPPKAKGFVKLDFEPIEHPFFQRVWTVIHVLDASSPLLKREARELVNLNRGHWPHELNNSDGIRESIQFDQIIVTLCGTSNVDANTVHALRVYEFDDLCVGYTFCSMLFRDGNGVLRMNENRLNDVTEQNGGGGEDLSDFYTDSFVSQRSIAV